MKISFVSFRNFFLILALGLLATTTQAQYATVATFSEDAFITSLTNETKDDFELTQRGALVISKYQEGAAIIKQDQKFGLINKQGYEICQPIYEEVHLFQHGYAAVKKNSKWTFVNKQGQKLTAFRYDWVGAFEKGLAPVMENGKWGILNEQGFEVVPTSYEAVKVDKVGQIWIQAKSKWQTFGTASEPIAYNLSTKA